LEIKGATTINLDNHFIAGFKYPGDERPSGNIFYVFENKTLTVNGPGTLKDATRGSGGAIYNDEKGTVTLNDVTITGCDAYRGGAIYNDKNATLNLNNVTFSGNWAEDTSDQPGMSAGGAIYNNNGTVNLYNVTFIGNSAKDIGGAIYNNGTLNIKGLIVANDNTGNAGAMDNVYLASGKVITLNGTLTEGTSIGVKLAAKSEEGIVFTSGYSTYHGTTGPDTFFSSDDAAQQISLKNDEVYLYNVNPALYVLNVPYLNQWEGEVVQTPTYIDACAKLSSIQPQDLGFGDGSRVYLLEDYSKWYIVDKDLTINQRIEVLGEVNIILADNTKLAATNSIYVSSATINGHTNTLHIWGQSTGQSMGLLTVTSAEENYAAIGGKGDRYTFGNDAGYLHFHGGEVQAVNHLTSNAAGIYGACVIGVEQYGTFIYGGKIFAVGGEHAPGIGSPFKYECGGIKITGGVVSAIGGENAAGIGSGRAGLMHRRSPTYSGNPADDDATEIRITGGDITAMGTGGGAGIGGGVGTDIYEGDGPRFIMTGGKVDALTSEGSAGDNESLAIGRGHNSYNTFTIHPVIIGSPIIRATKDVNENPVPVVTDWPSNVFYVHVIIEY
jgi:predicted outer membrane repeat protein